MDDINVLTENDAFVTQKFKINRWSNAKNLNNSNDFIYLYIIS